MHICNGRLQQLEGEKQSCSAVIETAVREVQSCLAEGSSPASQLGQALWTWTPTRLNLFMYHQRVPDFGSLCQTWITWKTK